MYSNDDIRAKIQEAERIKAQENQRNQEAEARRERERAEWARNDATVQRQREKSGELSSLHEKKERLLREVCQFSVYDANSWFAFHGKARELRNCQHQLDAVSAIF